MNDDTRNTEAEANDATENNTTETFTQVATCANTHRHERRRQTLRAKLEREAYEIRKQRRLRQEQNPLVRSVRSLLSLAKS